jgi:hypothetical protein
MLNLIKSRLIKYLTLFFLVQFFCIVILFLLTKIFSIGVYFFDGIISTFLASTVVFCFYWILNKRNLDGKDHVIILLISLLFFVVFPLTSSRSLSMNLLEHLNNKETFSEEEVKQVILNYVNSEGGYDRRVIEQQSIGNFLKNEDGTYTLSAKAKVIVKVSEFLKFAYSVN